MSNNTFPSTPFRILKALKYASPWVFNYTNPLQGRKWLKYLIPHKDIGFLIEPDLQLQKKELGFSFRSNSLGLRGPCNQKASKVIVGTSYAMGFTVNNSENWYEYSLDGNDWINLGLPVGPRELNALFHNYYHGSGKLLVFLYHPNYWQQAEAFSRWRASGKSIFSTLAWETGLSRCSALLLRKILQQFRDLGSGKSLIFKFKGKEYHINCLYNAFMFEEKPQIVSDVIAACRNIAESFDRVVVIRTYLKQDIVNTFVDNPWLRSTVQSYEKGWTLFKGGLSFHPKVSFYETQGFEMDDYQAWDTHWNLKGNKKFSSFISEIL